MFASELANNAFLMNYFQGLIADIPDERFAEQPVPQVNHPAWILGHLAWAADGVAGFLDAPKQFSDEFVAKYKGGSVPTSNRNDYPSKAEIIEAFVSANDRARQLLQSATPEQCSKPTGHARLRETMPTTDMALTFLMVTHPGVHLGQLSMWRRLIGMKPLF